MGRNNSVQTGRAGLISSLKSLAAYLRYNASNIFAGKFGYFLALAVVLFMTVSIIQSVESDTPPSAETVYYFLLVPGVLLIFYPSAYSIQSDVDSRMIETLFGIPDYRYKVWLARNLTQYLVIGGLLALLAFFSRVAMADFSVIRMVYHLMYPIFFLGSIGFLMATLTRSGNGTAVVMVIVILFVWIVAEPLEESRWNLFHNPFKQVDIMQTIMWADTTFYNRIYLLFGGTVSILLALLRLQNREKYV